MAIPKFPPVDKESVVGATPAVDFPPLDISSAISDDPALAARFWVCDRKGNRDNRLQWEEAVAGKLSDEDLKSFVYRVTNAVPSPFLRACDLYRERAPGLVQELRRLADDAAVACGCRAAQWTRPSEAQFGQVFMRVHVLAENLCRLILDEHPARAGALGIMEQTVDGGSPLTIPSNEAAWEAVEKNYRLIAEELDQLQYFFAR